MIAKECERERAEHVLRHMRKGGWGMAHLGTRSANMRFLLKDSGERITCTDQIREEATNYHSELLAQPDPRFLEEDVQLEERIERDQTESTHDAKATFMMEDVRNARLSLEPRKTSGQDQVALEMLRGATPIDIWM